MMGRLLVALLVVLGTVSAAPAQTFGPKNYAECVMLYAKKAASRDGGMLMRRACKCRYETPTASECAQYSKAALDCMISNLVPATSDDLAWGVERACRTKNPVQ